MTGDVCFMSSTAEPLIEKNNANFYSWWIVADAFLNLFFAVGIVSMVFQGLTPSFVTELGFDRAQVTQGFCLAALQWACRSACYVVPSPKQSARAG